MAKKNILKLSVILLLVLTVPFLVVEIFNKTNFNNNSLFSKNYNDPANAYFEDDNFYKCIIDNYNSINDLEVDYTYNLSDTELSTITSLSCSEIEKEDTDKIVDITGINELTELISLDLSNNKITGADLSSNLKLTSINLNNNLFEESKTIYVTDTINGANLEPNSVILPNTITNTFSNVTTTDDYLNINNNVISANDAGEYEFSYNTSIYSVSYVLKVVNLSSDKYIVDNTTNTIFVNESITDTVLLNHLSTNYGNVEINNNKIQVIYNSEVLREYTKRYISVSSETYDLTKKYIYVGTGNINLDEIVLSEGTKSINESNVLQIKYNNILLWEYDIVKVNSTYDLTKEYIYLGKNSYDTQKLTISNGTASVNTSNILELKYDDVLLDSYKLVIVDTEFSLNDGYIFLGSLSLKLDAESDMFSVTNAVASITSNNKLEIRYDNTLIVSYDLVKINSSYDWHIGYVYVGTSTFDINSVTVDNGSISMNGDVIEVRHDNTILGTYVVLSISFTDLKVENKLITLTEATTYNSFVNKITTNGVTVSVYTNANPPVIVTEGDITTDMVLKVFKNNLLLDSYAISDSYIEIPGLDLDNNEIYDVSSGTTVDDFKDLISTNGVITITDKDDVTLVENDIIGTGTKIKITLNGKNYVYTVVITGDVDGDGEITTLDAYLIVRSVLDINNLTGVYAEAGLTTNEEEITTRDAYNVILYILNKIEGFER